VTVSENMASVSTGKQCTGGLITMTNDLRTARTAQGIERKNTEVLLKDE